jgi:hypothetical protein
MTHPSDLKTALLAVIAAAAFLAAAFVSVTPASVPQPKPAAAVHTQ